jgi:hypothetical protein
MFKLIIYFAYLGIFSVSCSVKLKIGELLS